jgi:uncharacterized protein
MKVQSSGIRLAATDLSNHLACRHATTLDLQVMRGDRAAPDWAAPDLAVIRERGERHEKAYLAYLEEHEKLNVVNLSSSKNEKELVEETLKCMAQGVDVVAQGALADGQWFGRPDVLRRQEKPGGEWAWSYEVADTKLARETKAATILQLSLYSELLAKAQGSEPELMRVIPPGSDFQGESYRVAEYAAYFRYVKRRLLAATENGSAATYPEPVPHCDICRWFRECDAQRRGDDHLSLVAGMSRLQQKQLEAWQTSTVAKLAELPIPLKERPDHGSREAVEHVREQARVQVQGRTYNKLVHETRMPVVAGVGLSKLPEPSMDDLFLDVEGDPFVGESGLQYLIGFAYRDADGKLTYEKRWALNREDEKTGFEWLIDEIMTRWDANPRMHVYHFAGYESGVLKRLTGQHATREDQVDKLLRAETLVDLHQVFKQSFWASVEEYSLKKLEAFCGFARNTPLDQSRAAMRYVEHRLELGWGDEELPGDIRTTMEGYNSEDCFSAAVLRDWLEGERKRLLESGIDIPRPAEKTGDPSDKLKEKLDRTAALAERLCSAISPDPKLRSKEQSAQWLLAGLLNWHRREDRCVWQEGYRLAGLEEEDLLDERLALTNLRFVKRVDVGKQVPTDRYAFDPQKTNVRKGKDVYFADVNQKVGEVVDVNPAGGTVDVKKTKKTAELHPPSVFMWDCPVNTGPLADSLYRIGEWVEANGIDADGRYRAARDLLLRKSPRLSGGERLEPLASETPENTASRIALALDDSVFAIQGPPGSGKTYTGARMICELLKRGNKVGVTALSHKVIRNLLEAVVGAAEEKNVVGARCLHRENDGEESDGIAIAKKDNEEALNALRFDKANVVGGTAWLWSSEQAFEAVDVLFVDEAGQMSLADVLAVSQAAKSLVLLGDPQQLERPQKGSHPDGAENSALEHLLEGRKTITPEMGFLLPQSWRLHPEVCKFTSPVFYEGKLSSHEIAGSRILEGHSWLKGAGLWFVPVEHEGNRNSCAEEVEVVARIVDGLLKPEVKWFYSKGNRRCLKPEDILIVAPYNAQVADLGARLPKVKIGTVDKFQGQEAAVVIYSMTTSSPEDAPRGMEFLYSLNRLNVATSRAKTAVIVVGSPRLFEPDCRTPRQMQLANAFCQFAEMARAVDPQAL